MKMFFMRTFGRTKKSIILPRMIVPGRIIAPIIVPGRIIAPIIVPGRIIGTHIVPGRINGAIIVLGRNQFYNTTWYENRGDNSISIFARIPI